MSGWKRNIRYRMIAAVWLLLLAVSIAAPDARILAEDGTGSAAPVDGVVAGNSQFAWELYQKIAAGPENQGGNIFLSPYSVSAALCRSPGIKPERISPMRKQSSLRRDC